MALGRDLRVLARLVAAPLRKRGDGSHQDRLDAFYAGQASDYDHFRERLLHGRRELVAELVARLPDSGGTWLEIGGGTGANLEFLGERIAAFDRVVLLDLCAPLLDVARARVEAHGWTNVELVCGDATTYDGLVGEADAVALSYSLTMIPDWFAAIDVAHRALRPGGLVGAVDFTVSRTHEPAGRARHGWCTRAFWRGWFAMDDVLLDGDHLHYLGRRFDTEQLVEQRVRLPYMPFVRAPIYRYVGRKRQPS